MNASHDLITVFGGIFGLLAVFSLIGAGLKYRVARGEPHASVLARGRAVRTALDQVMAAESAPVGEGAELAFFPPVTGG